MEVLQFLYAHWILTTWFIIFMTPMMFGVTQIFSRSTKKGD